MAVSVAVVNGTLNTTGNSDFTVSGFGDVEAAIILGGTLGTDESTRDNALWSFGFWGYNGGSSTGVFNSYKSQHNVGTSNTWMPAASGTLDILSSTSNTVLISYSFARTTDGLRATIASGSTTLARKCTVLLFKGLTNHAAGTVGLNSTTPVTVSTGFKPDVIFAIGRADVDGFVNIVNCSFGVAHHASADTGTPSKQYCVNFNSEDNVAAALVNSSVNNDCISRAYSNDGGTAVKTTIQSLDTDSFDVVSDAATSTNIAYLALELDDPDNFFAAIYDAQTSGTGTEAKSEFGFTPVAVGQANVRNATVNNTSTSPTGALSVGFAVSGTEGAWVIADEDAADPTDTSTRRDETYFAPFYDHDDAVDALAKVTTWGSDGVTLTWDDAAAAAYKYLFWAIGADAGGGAVTGTAAITLGALTASGSGSLAISGSSAVTLGTLTAAGVGALAIKGSSAVTLGDATVAAEGQSLSSGSGTAAITLGAMTASAAGKLAVSGTLGVTLGTLTAAGAGKLAVAGTLGVTLGSLTVDAAGSLTAPDSRIGSAAITLADATATAAGKLAILGQAAITLDGVTTAATGSVAIAGALGIVLGDLVVAASGLEITSDTRIGSAAITLADLSVAAFNAPALTRAGNRRLRESSPRLQMNDMPTGARFRKGRLPSVY